VERTSKIFIAGERTLIGAALRRVLVRDGYTNLVGPEPSLADIDTFFAQTKPEYVFVAAGQSGGINANQKYPADLCLDNLLVATHLLPAAHRHGVRKLLYLASSCVYPKHCAQPMAVESLLTGPLEPTNDAYAIAKLAGLKLCQAYRRQHGAPFVTAIPADIFGPGAKFDAEDSHVVPSLMAKMHDAKQRGLPSVTLWGTGSPRREFTYADDLAAACLLVMREYDSDLPINLGSGETVSIRELAEMIRAVIGFTGELRWDTTRPDGMPVKSLDTTPLRTLGWRASVSLRAGLEETYRSLLGS
jgi:GDP-L-fucose synthase